MREIQFREALREALNEEMRRDPKVFLIGEEVAEYNGAYKVSQGMLDEFGPERVIDTPISELGFTGIGVGAAHQGQRVGFAAGVPFAGTLLEPSRESSLRIALRSDTAN